MRVLLDATVPLVDARGPPPRSGIRVAPLGREVSGVFAFGPDGLPQQMTAERFFNDGDLRPWSGVYRDWRTVSGMLVPFEADVTWLLESAPPPPPAVAAMVFAQPSAHERCAYTAQ